MTPLATAIEVCGWVIMVPTLLAMFGALRTGSEALYRTYTGWAAVGEAVIAALNIVQHAWWGAGFFGGLAVMFAWIWWKRRKRGDRAPRAWGYKSAAKLADLVTRQRRAGGGIPQPDSHG